jgi:hypothetical protein
MFVILSLYVDSHVSKGLLDVIFKLKLNYMKPAGSSTFYKNSPINKVHYFFKV